MDQYMSRYNVSYGIENLVKVFLKFEGYPEKGKVPRVIGATGVYFNYVIGRWIVPMTELLAKYFNQSHKFFLPLDSSGETIATYITEFKFLFENDFSSFDGTQISSWLKRIFGYYKLMGMDDEGLRCLHLNLTKIPIRWRAYFFKIIVSNFRVSGNSDTLLGNTLLNLDLMILATGGALSRMIIKGDDSVCDFHPSLLPQVESFLLRAGFKAKIKQSTLNNVEFCSKLVVPVVGGYALGPKIGRILAKTFWCKHSELTIEEMQVQFYGIIKGLQHDIAHVPILNQLPYSSETLLLENFQYQSHNADLHEMSDETIKYYAERYSISNG